MITCQICSDSLTSSKDVYHTPCRHVFHHVCLEWWLQRSMTCPQCQERTTRDEIHKLNFNYSDDIDIVFLKNKNVSLKLENEKLKNKIIYLRCENRKIEGLEIEIKFLKEIFCIDMKKSEIEKEHLKKNFENLEKELKIISNERKELNEKYEKLYQESMGVLKESQSRFWPTSYTKKELETKLMVCESEKKFLETQLFEMQADTHKCVCNKVSAENKESLNLKALSSKQHNAIKNSNTVMSGCSGSLNKDDGCVSISNNTMRMLIVETYGVKTYGGKTYGVKRQKPIENRDLINRVKTVVGTTMASALFPAGSPENAPWWMSDGDTGDQEY